MMLAAIYPTIVEVMLAFVRILQSLLLSSYPGNKPRLKSFVGYASKRNMNNLDVEVETPIVYEYIPIEYWDRSDECKEAKLTHMDRLDLFCEDRVYTILSTILWDRDINLEPNMFPYDTPKGIEHYTLWCVYEMTHSEICRYVENWLSVHMPHVRRWNYDDNSGERSFQIFHVHVYIETIPYSYIPDPERSYYPSHNTNSPLRIVNATV